jgi:outer membrane receptor protein involved in Fe transport
MVMASRRILLALCSACILAGPMFAHAQSSSMAGGASQSLGNALSEFAAQTGLQVVYVSEVAESLKVNPVPAGLPPNETLERLLAGTGLRFEFLNDHTVRIFADGARGVAAKSDAATLIAATALHHSEADSTRLDEVVVTATHQAELASDVPISLTVWSQDEMRISGVKGMDEIGALTPGLSYDWRSNLGAGVYTALDMRGITGTHGVSTGIFVDDTAMPSASIDSYQRAFPATFDLERVEVLRGAQGMLLGQRTLGGAIRFITRPPSPSEFSGNATAELSTTEGGAMSYEAGVAAGGPVVDGVLGIRVSGWYRSEGGFVDRLDPITSRPLEQDSNGIESKSGRIGVAWMPSDATRITTTLIYDSNRASDAASFSLDESDPAHGIFRKSNPILQPREDRFHLTSIKVEHGSDKVDFLAVSSYIDRRNNSIHDLNCLECGEPLFNFVVYGDQRTLQQELRLTSADSDAKFTWLAGAHLSRTESTARLGVEDHLLEEREGTHIEQSQIEGYLELSRKLGSRLEASAGARLARSGYDYASLPTPLFTGGDDETLVIPRFDLSYHGESGNLVYLTAAKGYGGGSVVGVIPGCEPLELLADTLWNYELGTKADIFGGRAHVEASLFDSRWGNRQRDPIAFACLTSWQKGQAESDGFELSGQALVGERTTIGLEVSYIDARYTHSVELDGVQIVHAGDAVHNGRLPWSLSAFFDYEFPPILDTSITLHVEDHWHGGKSRPRLERDPDSPFYRSFGNADSTTNILNLRANVQVGPADIAVFVINALDSSPLLNEFPGFGTAYTLTPRTVGISANWRF